ncbi:MAG: DnaD domain protein [Erysipelotrichaceae bacterium]|nr:DnaD domain protein [Erysipelotrichaceae bacterium]
MKDLFHCPYIAKRDWILFEGAQSGLNQKEMLLCLLIDLAQEKGIDLDYGYLALKSGMSHEEIDRILGSLGDRGKLKISADGGKLHYDLSGLFREPQKDPSDLFGTFEDVFGRPLSPTEMEKLSDLSAAYSDQEILQALRTADAYRKLSLAYVEGILRKRYEQKG